MAPTLVCVTVQTSGKPDIRDANSARVLLAGLLKSDVLIVGHNVAYDLAVVCEAFPELRSAVFDAYASDRVADTMIRQQLLDIAAGTYRGRLGDKGKWIVHRYGLEDIARRCAGLVLKKTGFRLFYSFFRDVPIDRWDAHARALQIRAAAYREGAEDAAFDRARRIIGEAKWHDELEGLIAAAPQEARTYALDDVAATFAVYMAQEKHVALLHDQYRQTRAAFWLHLASAWGLRTDGVGVDRLREETQAQYDDVFADLLASALVRPDGRRDTKAAKRLMVEVCQRDNLPLRRTDAHEGDQAKCKGADGAPLPAGHQACVEHICLDADACTATGDETLTAYAELSTLKKVLSNDVEALSKGTHLPVHPSYGLAETGRTTCRGPNIQNLRRKAGIREAFVPRPGKVFAQADYPQLELYTLAQCCVSWLGRSKLADALNGGLDPHLWVAAHIVGTSYDEAAKRLERADEEIDAARQTAKVANFGFPGGLGIAKLVVFAKKTYRVDLSEARAKALKEQWFAAWPEMPHYFARINALCDTADGRARVETLFTKRVRGGASYCAACNNGFQALGSDCAKNAGFLISRALYVDQGSPLFNSRLVAFVHDEFIVETEDSPRAHDAATELARLMCEGANVYLPDVPIKTSKLKPLLMRRWSKRAKPAFDSQGRLVPWQ